MSREFFSILLQAKCDVNARDYDGWTPLHGAAHWGETEACKLLVDNYCDMDIKNYAVSFANYKNEIVGRS